MFVEVTSGDIGVLGSGREYSLLKRIDEQCMPACTVDAISGNDVEEAFFGSPIDSRH